MIDRTRRRLRDWLAIAPWTPWGPSILRPAAFRGLRVIIVGPAETVVEDLAGTRVDDYDVVVRLNNGIALADARPDIMGRRTDILFHNLRETGERSAGAISGPYLREKGVGMVVYPHWRTSALRRLFRDKQTALARENGPQIKLLPPPLMMGIRADLGERPPTIGTCASLFFLASPAAEVAIHGFTFFETAYASGYNDAIGNADDARAWVDKQGAHEPISEKALLRKRLQRPHGPKVVLGVHVSRHLDADTRAPTASRPSKGETR